MKLTITNCNDVKFIEYLIKQIREYLFNTMYSPKFEHWNLYLQTIPEFASLDKPVTVQEILLLAISYLKFYKFDKNYEIVIDNNKKVLDTNAKLYDICKLINYGTLDIPGYPVFTNAFDYVLDHIDFLYLKYQKGYHL